MRRMYSQKQIERFAEIVAQRVIEQGINLDNIYISSEHNGYLLMTDESSIVEQNPATLDLKVKTIEQSQANQTFSFDITASDTTNFERVSQYAKVEIVNGELHIIGLAKFHNKDEASHNFSIGLMHVDSVPDAIAEKIYGDSGDNIKSANAGIIRIVPIGINSSNGVNILALRIYSQSANRLSFYMPSAQAVAADGNVTISFEANLSLF